MSGLIDVNALIEAHYQYCNEHHGEADCFYTWSLELMRQAPPIKTKQIKYFDDLESVWKIGEVIVDEQMD